MWCHVIFRGGVISYEGVISYLFSLTFPLKMALYGVCPWWCFLPLHMFRPFVGVVGFVAGYASCSHTEETLVIQQQPNVSVCGWCAAKTREGNRHAMIQANVDQGYAHNFSQKSRSIVKY